MASEKLEYSARTIRGKIHSKLSEYLVDFSTIDEHPIPARENLFMVITSNPKMATYMAACMYACLICTIL